MADMMMVAKLDEAEVSAVREMTAMWLSDPEIEENSGGLVEVSGLYTLLENLPFVEPNEQPVIESMISFFNDDETVLTDRVMDSLNRVFG